MPDSVLQSILPATSPNCICNDNCLELHLHTSQKKAGKLHLSTQESPAPIWMQQTDTRLGDNFAWMIRWLLAWMVYQATPALTSVQGRFLGISAINDRNPGSTREARESFTIIRLWRAACLPLLSCRCAITFIDTLMHSLLPRSRAQVRGTFQRVYSHLYAI